MRRFGGGMYTVLLAALALDLTLRDVLADLPHDAGAVVFVLLMGGFVLLTWYGSKPSTIERFRSTPEDRKSTRLNSSHVKISYAVFCLKKKKTTITSRT